MRQTMKLLLVCTCIHAVLAMGFLLYSFVTFKTRPHAEAWAQRTQEIGLIHLA